MLALIEVFPILPTSSPFSYILILIHIHPLLPPSSLSAAEPIDVFEQLQQILGCNPGYQSEGHRF